MQFEGKDSAAVVFSGKKNECIIKLVCDYMRMCAICEKREHL